MHLSHNFPSFPRTIPAERLRFRPNPSDPIRLLSYKRPGLPIFAAVLAFLTSCTSAGGSPAVPVLTCDLSEVDGIHLSSEGVVELQWSDVGTVSYQLEQLAGNGRFELRYRGSDRGSVRTGLVAGEHVFRVRAIDSEDVASEWSDVSIKVEYMDPIRVRLLLILGGIVVLATISTIIRGHLSHRKEAQA